MLNLVYYSNVSETTHRLARKIDINAVTGGNAYRLPLRGHWDAAADGATDHNGQLQPYILLTPTYGGTSAADRKRHVPPAVIRFLNNPDNRANCVAVAATGNRNFGRDYGLAGDILATKLNVPLLGKIELGGDHEDVGLMQMRVQELRSSLIVSGRLKAHMLEEALA